jgi:methionyl-tRNA formyltransferase
MPMRILLLANRDLASNLALNLLLPQLRAHSLSVWLSARVGGGGAAPVPLQRLRFLEQTLFNVLVFPLLDRHSEAPRQLCSFETLAQRHRAPLREENAINSPPALNRLQQLAPDLILSIRYGGILREAAIAVPQHGVLNLHSGLLPDYRGVMATFWAMLHGEREIGTTLHRISDGGIDTGAVIAQTRQRVNYQQCYLSNVLQLYPAGCRAMLEAVHTLAAGEALTEHPQGTGGQYFSFPGSAELARFEAAGLQLYDEAEVLALARSQF